MISIAPLEPDQFALAAGWLADSEINRWLTSEWRGRAAEPAMLAIAVRSRKNRIYTVRQDGVAVGLVGLADIDALDRCAMAWYILGEVGLGGKGVISAAVGQMCRLGFTDLGLRNIYAWIMQPNQKSRRVLEKNGFRPAGRLRRAADFSGAAVDREYFDLVPDDSSR